MIARGHGVTGGNGGRQYTNVLTGVTLDDDQRSLVEANTGIAGLAAKRCRERWGVDLEDAYASALFGLICAAVAFDEEHGVKFSTFAYQCCLNQVRREHRQLPQAMQTRDRHGNEQTPLRVVSIDDQIDPNSNRRARTFGSMISDRREPTPAERLEHDEMLAEAHARLDEFCSRDERMHTIVRIRTEGGTLADAACAIGVTRERVRQIEARMVGAPLGRSHRDRVKEAVAS